MNDKGKIIELSKERNRLKKEIKETDKQIAVGSEEYNELLAEAENWKYNSLDFAIMENRFTIMSIVEKNPVKKAMLKEILNKIKNLINYFEAENQGANN